MLVRQRAAGAKPGHRRQDNVGLDLAQAVEVERQRAQNPRRQIGDNDIGGGDELFDDLAAPRCGRIERHAELVAVHRQEHRTTASGASADRDVSAVLAALDPLDADHLGAEIAQQRGAKRPRDVAAKIEHADPIEYARH